MMDLEDFDMDLEYSVHESSGVDSCAGGAPAGLQHSSGVRDADGWVIFATRDGTSLTPRRS